jgi:hypothetical protein
MQHHCRGPSSAHRRSATKYTLSTSDTGASVHDRVNRHHDTNDPASGTKNYN